MPRYKRNQPTQLEDLPNIGKSIAADLRSIGILWPDQLAKHEPIIIFRELSKVMGHRHDPCVLYTLLSVGHFLKFGEALPWWSFTAAGKSLLKSSKKGSQP
jgi:DNA transformation protein